MTNLKNLWLGENPCAKLEGYRLSVIKALPQLQKLDNVQITPDEVKEAQRRGKGLCHPDDAQDESEEEFPQQQYNRYQEPETDYTPVQRSPPRQDVSGGLKRIYFLTNFNKKNYNVLSIFINN